MKYTRSTLYVLLALFIAVTILLLPRFVKVKTLVCISQFGPCDDNIINGLSKSLGVAYKDAKDFAIHFLESEKSAAEFSVSFNFPDKLIVNLVQQKAVFAIEKSGSYFLISPAGEVLSIEGQTALPTLSYDGVSGVGDLLDENTLLALTLLRRIDRTYKVKDARLEGEVLIVNIDQYDVLIPVTKEVEVTLGSLAVILARIESEVGGLDRPLTEIDLRYKNPILR